MAARAGRRRRRKPHNAKTGHEFESLGELVDKLGAEPMRVTLDGEEVEMSWAERSLRVSVDRALAGNRRELALVLELMIKNPEAVASVRKVYFVRGALANV